MKDEPKEDIISWLVDLWLAHKSSEIVFFTARSDAFRDVTIDWLDKHIAILCSRYKLVMRKDGDFRPHLQVKTELFEKHIEKKAKRFDRVVCFEDHPDIQDLWREKGFDVVCIFNEHYRVNGEIKEK